MIFGVDSFLKWLNNYKDKRVLIYIKTRFRQFCNTKCDKLSVRFVLFKQTYFVDNKDSKYIDVLF